MKVSSISKKYNDKVVLNDVSLTLNKKEIVGLVGKNGAGKSTLMKIITQMQLGHEGSVDTKSKIGYFIESPKLYQNKSALWHLKYFSRIFGNNFDLDEYKNIIESIGMRDVLDKKVKTYSLGMKEKLGVLLSLLNAPEYVILDEPTNGMDIESSMNLLEEIRNIANKRDVGFMISSHKLEDIDMICDRILFLDQGKISEAKNKNDETKYDVTIIFKTDDDREKFLKKQKLGKIMKINDREVRLETEFEYSSLMKFITDESIEIKNYSSEKKSLRSIYLDKMAERN